MEKYTIRFSTLDEIKDFVAKAEKCDFDIDLHYNHIWIDAKSLMGVMAAGINKELLVICHSNDRYFKRYISRYAAA